MTKTRGVGIVGLSADGGWGARGHLPALRAVDGFEVRGLAASSPDAARRASAMYEVPLAVADPGELARHDDIDVIAICVRVPEHARLVEAVIGTGKTVYCEWPLARTVAEAEHLERLAASAGAKTAVGLQARSTPTVRYVRDLVADGYLGTVLSTTLVGAGGGWGGVTTTRLAYTLDPANGATMLTIPFGHTLDAVQFVLGDLVDLTATTGTRRPAALVEDSGERIPVTAPDQVAVTGQFPGGAVFAAHYRGGSSAGTGFRWEINGSDGDLVLTGASGHLQFDQVTLAGARGGAGLAPLEVPASYLLTGDALADNSAARSVAHAYLQLARDLDDGTHLVPDFTDGVAHHRTLHAIEHASEHGVRVSLPPRRATGEPT